MDSDIERLQILITQIRQRGDPAYRNTLARHLTQLGMLYAQKRESQEALNCLETALTLYRTLGNAPGYASACFSIAAIYDFSLDDKGRAVTYIKLGIRSYKNNPERALYEAMLLELLEITEAFQRTPENILRLYTELGIA